MASKKVSDSVRFKTRVTLRKDLKGDPIPVNKARKAKTKRILYKTVTKTVKKGKRTVKVKSKVVSGYETRLNFGNVAVINKVYYVNTEEKSKAILRKAYKDNLKKPAQKISAMVQQFQGKIVNPYYGTFGYGSTVSKGEYIFTLTGKKTKKDSFDAVTKLFDKVIESQELYRTIEHTVPEEKAKRKRVWSQKDKSYIYVNVVKTKPKK